MVKWEYALIAGSPGGFLVSTEIYLVVNGKSQKVNSIKGGEKEQMLQALSIMGEQGWELVSNDSLPHLYLKRPKKVED